MAMTVWPASSEGMTPWNSYQLSGHPWSRTMVCGPWPPMTWCIWTPSMVVKQWRLPGLGDSTGNPPTYEKTVLATYVHLLLDRLDKDRAVQFVAHDFGVGVAYALASQYRQQAAGLFLMDFPRYRHRRPRRRTLAARRSPAASPRRDQRLLPTTLTPIVEECPLSCRFAHRARSAATEQVRHGEVDLQGLLVAVRGDRPGAGSADGALRDRVMVIRHPILDSLVQNRTMFWTRRSRKIDPRPVA
jgi:pimeloyl-ACP methyl ester carboxylesterase